MKWALQRGTQIIPKSIKLERLQENLEVIDWDLTAEEMQKIDALDKGRRFNDPAVNILKLTGTFYPIFQ